MTSEIPHYPSEGEPDEISTDPILNIPLIEHVANFLESKEEVDEDLEKDLRELGYIIHTIGIVDIRERTNEEIDDLWENRNQDSLAVEDLFYYIVERFRATRNPKGLEPIFYDDLIEYSRHLPTQIRNKQTNDAINILRSTGLSAKRMEKTFERGSERQKRALRRLAWVASQPFMSNFRGRAAQMMDQGNPHKLSELCVMAAEDVKWQLFLHLENKPNNYELDISKEQQGADEMTKLLKRAYVMCENVFYGKKYDIEQLPFLQ